MTRLGVIAVFLSSCANAKNGGGEVDAGVDVDAPTGPTVDAPPVGCQPGGEIPCAAIYVTKTGNDTAAGTQDAPLKSLSAAVAKAAMSTPPLAVFVGAGSFSGSFVMKPGVSIYGGFDATWKRTPGTVTELTGTSPTITFTSITTATLLDGLTIKSSDATMPGDSSFAIVATGSKNITLNDVTVEPGAGAGGVDGAAGTAGAVGLAGFIGNPGVENSSGLFCDENGTPSGGAGGPSSCGGTGGAGGTPGTGSSGGNAGANGSGGTPGGAGAGGSGGNGSVGGNGANGASGTNGGAGVSAGVFMMTTYVPANGSDGTAGSAGNGGGGGGGGGGGTTDCDSTGSSGGGGGGGGCGGTAGKAGSGGGGSFGIVALDSQITIKGSMVIAGRGGDGGRGGDPGPGGAGGAGGAGGPYGGSSEQDDGGFGAAGGSGGKGGAGGAGGGGGGGPSAATVCLGTSAMTIPSTTLSGGTGGAGGMSMGNAGAAGTSAKAIGCSFF